MLNVTYGVPHGGILGPTLFLIHINTLLYEEMREDMYCYANDTCLIYRGTRDEVVTHVNSDLEKINMA